MTVQQTFLTNAMVSLGLTHEAFAKRLNVTEATVRGWLAPVEEQDFKILPVAVWRYIREITHGMSGDLR